jgi:5-methylcytosine-specific restriction protein A
MDTYLLAWSSKRWEWEDLAEMSDMVKVGKPISTRWSCGKSKRLKKGDRVFLIRLGEEPKGIFASGTVIQGSYEDLHWEDHKAAAGETSFFVQVQFDTLLNPDINLILPREILKNPPFSEMHWDTQMSGVHIPDNVAEELERVWVSFSSRGTVLLLPEEVVETGMIYEGAVHRISVNAYERNPEARRKCIAHYGLTCFVCGFDFVKTYGEVGKDLIHVHHLRQISEIGQEYQIDPIKDLRPVCPNCHAIIHRRKPAYTVNDVQGFLRRDKPQ